MKSAVIDIGSNAIRTIVYESALLGSPVLFHSKFKCDLKGLLDKEEDDHYHQIYVILNYFTYYFKKNNVENIKCVATEVLRKHKKTPEFILLIKEKYNLNIEILTGDREAELTATGLISGISSVNGLAADFGGGSLELIKIENSNIKKTISIPFGTNINNKSIAIESVFDHISDNFKLERFENLYLIGGVFRVIGRSYMYVMNYPLKILHNIIISIDSFYKYVSIIEQNESFTLTDSQKNAIKIIKSIIDTTGIKNIVISSYGLKEGVRFEYLLNKDESKKNIIYERTKMATNFDEASCDLESYFQILKRLELSQDIELKETLFLTIMLTQFYFKSGNAIGGIFVHDFIMSSDIPFSEKQRIMIITSLSFIFFNNIPHNIKKLSNTYLSSKEYSIATIVGNFIKIIYEIDGAVFNKPSFSMMKNRRFIEIQSDYTLPTILYHKVKKNLKEISAFIKKYDKYN